MVMMQKPLTKAMQAISVFGKPWERGDVTVIMSFCFMNLG
jgi:hypothetical protein